MSRTDRERGAAAVELALVLPILVTLVFGIAEFGRAYQTATTLSGAARAGARVMALQNDAAAARSAAKTAAGSVPLTDAQIAVSPVPCVSTPTSSVSTTVTITYPMKYVTKLFGSSVTLHGRGVMRCGG